MYKNIREVQIGEEVELWTHQGYDPFEIHIIFDKSNDTIWTYEKENPHEKHMWDEYHFLNSQRNFHLA